MIDVAELKERLFHAERTMRDLAKHVQEPDSSRLMAKAEGVSLARSYVEEMAKW